MSVPVVVVTGFLGAGKTTFINDLLRRAEGLRIAAIVNDFGSINIDAALLESQTDEVIGLKNGCICCSLQGDLLRTLKTALSGVAPDLVVIEASGVADPSGIVQALMDPVLFRAAALDSVVCVVDAEDLAEDQARWSDPLWQAQVRGADLIQLSKVAAGGDQSGSMITRLATLGPQPVFGADGGSAEIGDLIGATVFRRSGPAGPPPAQARFATVEWRREGPVSLPDFQLAIQTLAPDLLRAKGVLNTVGPQSRRLLFQMVGRRASLAPSDLRESGCALVLIGEKDRFDPVKARELLDAIPS